MSASGPGRRARTGAAALACALLAASPLQAQTASSQPPVTVREDVIVTATLSPTGFDDLARSVQTITRDDLDRLGISSVVQGLRLLPGLDVRARGPHDIQTDFTVRGATFGQALVLVDGWRLNDSQSGHHNGDLPVTMAGLERIEVLAGAGSAAHGADALGGTIHLLSRRDAHARVSALGGQHGVASVDAALSGYGLPRDWAVAGWSSRSGGFMFDRDFAQGGATLRAPVGAGAALDVRHVRKAFGANGFYGNSPSKEWTDLTLAGLSWQRTAGGWTSAVRGQYKNHGDHFRWDIRRPGFAENRHRTDAVLVRATAARTLGPDMHVTVGASGGGDWIESSNLGDRAYGQGAAFGEVRWQARPRTTVQAGLRLDHYSSFGTAWNPSLSAGTWITDTVRVRASAARAFRIPTYTELYYTDPGHQARADLRPERGWTIDGGLDWSASGWLVTISPYRRADEDVIDWVKDAPADRWQTTNVRDVTTTGVEIGATRRWGAALVRGFVTGQSVDAPALTTLSKYVLEYVTRSAGLSVATPVVGPLHAAVVVDHRRRFGSDAYTVVDLRLSHRLRRLTLFADVTNLFDEDYVEIAGVAMPGRWISAGLTIR